MCELLFFETESGEIVNLGLIRNINVRKKKAYLELTSTNFIYKVKISILELEEIKKLIDVRRLKK